MKHSPPHILLMVPWITDFAAYNLWIKPLGLLYIASLLRENGFRITLVDCLDYSVTKRRYQDGKFHKVSIEKPFPLKTIPRNYSRYGMPEEILLRKLSSIERPDAIAVTSGMSYWYPGVFRLIDITRKCFEGVPIILGGVYATLCYEHASKRSGADFVFKRGDVLEASRLIAELTDWRPQTPNLPPGTNGFPYPAFDLYPEINYVCILTSRGCPFSCTYCASSFLTGKFERRNPVSVAREIEYWTMGHEVSNIVFYDDALLVDPSDYFIPMVREVVTRGVRSNFHAPNGLHIREIDEEVGSLLFQGGFRTIRLGFESSHERTQTETGGKVTNLEFQRAVHYLKKAGYQGKEIGIYIMAGLPYQRVEEVEQTIAYVKEAGAKPVLVEYSPIPHTQLFEEARQASPFDLENEPLYHNNSILPCQWEGFTLEDYRRLKAKLREG